MYITLVGKNQEGNCYFFFLEIQCQEHRNTGNILRTFDILKALCHKDALLEKNDISQRNKSSKDMLICYSRWKAQSPAFLLPEILA